MECVHLLDCTRDKKKKGILYKRYALLTSSHKPFWCSVHRNDCKLVTVDMGFVLYLHCIYQAPKVELLYEYE
ncbi:hypothetical protein GOP47_0006211 [Adiantum capillus-veneris]|uniref:Uncharacterized protein n=1 Tax=Adiantum capillus-veneris TaxID=13818 RepID=A0A9D4V2F1_ADICA|nr:hypothetical protein GOP47_0006211 [Adiantum capillus-veneris]